MLQLYLAWLKQALLSQAQYRMALIIWLLHRTIESLIYLAVWSAVAQANGGSVVTYNTHDFANYYILSLMVSHLTHTWHIGWYDYLIRSGEFSTLLLRPVHPVHADIADNFASKLLTVSVMLLPDFVRRYVAVNAYRSKPRGDLWAVAGRVAALHCCR